MPSLTFAIVKHQIFAVVIFGKHLVMVVKVIGNIDRIGLADCQRPINHRPF